MKLTNFLAVSGRKFLFVWILLFGYASFTIKIASQLYNRRKWILNQRTFLPKASRPI